MLARWRCQTSDSGTLRPDVNNEQRRQRAHDEQGPPAKVRKDDPVDDRREKKTEGIALLQNSRGQAPRLGRQTFHRERRAQPPLAAHPDPVERAKNEEDGVVRRKGRQQFHHRIENDVDHQRNAPAEAVAEHAENERAERAASSG